MSAYVVADQTINRVLSHLNADDFRALVTAAFGDGTLVEFVTGPRWSHPGSNRPTDAELGAALRNLNEEAVAQRYPGEPVEDLPGPVPYAPYAYAPLLVGAVPAYKALRCLLYQCSEGDVPERPLYRALEALSHRWAAEIVSELPAYAAAPWG